MQHALPPNAHIRASRSAFMYSRSASDAYLLLPFRSSLYVFFFFFFPSPSILKSIGCSWVAFPCDSELISPAWMLMPVGNLVGAVAARPVSEDYLEWGWFLFGVGTLLWLALWPATFQKVCLRWQ